MMRNEDSYEITAEKAEKKMDMDTAGAAACRGRGIYGISGADAVV